MRNVAIILICACLGGCVGYRLSHIHGMLNSNAVTTPYGPLNGNIEYDAVTCFGQCPQAKMEIIHDGTTNANQLK